MIFEVNAEDIKRFDEDHLVALLRRLIQAELNKNSIPLRSGTAPAQLTIPDGGEDARVSWTGGPNETDYLPSRFTIFQCKKGKTSPKSLRVETQKKSSVGRKNPELNEALEEALPQSGAYVVVTATPVVGTNIDRRIKAIQEGISQTGNDPSLLSSIQIYDCNILSDWTNAHPSVALWLNSWLRDVHLGGFQTFEDWGRSPEISKIEFQQSDDPRFVAKGTEIRNWQAQDASISQDKSFDEIREVISEFSTSRGKSIRVAGPSGYGKTRFVHQLIASRASLPQDVLDASQIIYCIYEDIKDQLQNIVRDIADSGSQALIIVDDCPDAIHTKLTEIVQRDGSRCLLLTIGVETKAGGMRGNLVVELKAAPDELIDHISEAINKEVSKKNSSLIRELSQGFPRMAVYASRAFLDGDEELSSVETLISRIIWGDHEEDQSARESLQLLSLFTIVGLENEAAHELEEIASYSGKTIQQMYRELNRFNERALFRQGDYGEVQPIPLAMRLSNQWLESNPAGQLEALFRSLSEEMKLKMVGRLRWVSWSDKINSFARALLVEALPDEAALDSEFGSRLLDRFVHLAPDATMAHLNGLLADKSIDELVAFEAGRRHTIWALEKLVFRHQTFDLAARLLLNFGAAENEKWANNASGQFIGLFQLYLSGTEAPPAEKLLVLDSGLADADERVRKLCLKALDRMLQSGHFSRSGGSESIGSGELLEDWQPRTNDEIISYYLAALSRLEQIALNTDHSTSETALNSIGAHLRGLLSIQPMLDEIQAMIARIRETHRGWSAATLAVNAWLFFDREEADEAYRRRLREYHDELLPTDVLDQIYFYSSGWALDIHDPDVCYDREGDNEHDYGVNRINQLVDSSPKGTKYFFPLMDRYLDKLTNTAGIALVQIAKHVDDPVQLAQYIIEGVSDDGDPAIFSALLPNVISGATQTGRKKGLECLEHALATKHLSASFIEFISAAGLDDELMQRAIGFIENDTVQAHQVSVMASGDILMAVDHNLIEALVSLLATKREQGAWAAIEFLAYVLHRASLAKTKLLPSVKRSVTNPTLFDKPRYSNMDWYHWCELAGKILDCIQMDDEFNEEIADFIIGVTTIEDFSAQLAFDTYAKKILLRLISSSPRLIWEKYHEAYADKDRVARYRLESLFGSDMGHPSSPGVLNSVPQDIYVPWMLEDKEGRMPFVLNWIQLFSQTDNERSWAPEFVTFIDAHVDHPENLRVLSSRLETGSWVGSFANKLESEREQLLQLRELSNNSGVHLWIDQAKSRMEQQIADERRQDANREASYRA